MNPALAVKLRPAGPWRSGPDSGARNQVDALYHSDTLFAAVTSAMTQMGLLEEWLADTVTGEHAPALRFSSCFPFAGDILFVAPPRTLWPPPASALAVTRVRWKSARFVPREVVVELAAGQPPDEARWCVDGPSECLMEVGHAGPFRTAVRSNAAVDRLSGSSERHSTACLEFREGAGLWALVSFADDEQRERWSGRVRAAFRLLADSGFGGERSRGWGRAEDPEFLEGTLPDLVLPAAAQEPAPDNARWLLSLYAPAATDEVDWTRGAYGLVVRGGRVESPAGHGALKKELRMICEGSVLVGAAALRGSAPDVAPDGFPHPVYRAGYALSIPLPAQVTA
ncbi:MAG: hypothetical protein ACE15B_25235 [Bryobacteraceae bacterium]